MLPFVEALRRARKEQPLTTDLFSPRSLTAEDTEPQGPDPLARRPEMAPWQRGSLFGPEREAKSLRRFTR